MWRLSWGLEGENILLFRYLDFEIVLFFYNEINASTVEIKFAYTNYLKVYDVQG